MSQPVRQFSFASGEIAPFLYARTDLNRYENGLRSCRNMMIMRHGGATGRPGTMYAGTSLNGGAAVRLIPFIFNETGLGQSYVLEFGDQYITFYQNGAPVIVSGPIDAWLIGTAYTPGNYVSYNGVTYLSILAGTGHQPDVSATYWRAQTQYQIFTPYLQADLAAIQFAQSADIITLVHPSYAPRELNRLGAINWTLTTPTFGSQIPGPTPVDITGTAGADQLSYAVTSVNNNGDESDSINYGFGISVGDLAEPSPTTPVSVGWPAVNGAVTYRVYRGANNLVAQQLGFVGEIPYVNFTDTGIEPDYTQQPPLNQTVINGAYGPGGKGHPVTTGLFVGAGNYPAAVGFSQQRRVFGATNNNPLGFWASQPGLFYNYNTHVQVQDSDAVIGQITGEEVNAIEHILELKFMIILTAGAEIYVQGNGSGVVTPSSINASTQSQYGAGPLKPLKVGDTLLFNQSLGAFIRDFGFDFAIDGYRGNDITVFSSHLFDGYTISDWAYQKVPDSIVWAARSDGKLLSCTYVREQQVLAWTRHDFTNGYVENVCTIPENGEYALYLSIRRVINGATVRYIERLSSRIWSDPITASYLDCFSSYDGRNTGSTTMTLTALGGFQTGITAYQQQLTLTASASYFGGVSVGNQIFLQDAEWVSSHGMEGNQIRLTIQSITNGTVAVVTPSGAVPAEFQAIATTNWARAVQSVSGLSYLRGQEVSVWADRFVVGSPLNYHLTTTYTVSDAGTLTLDKPYSVIYVGLPMTQDLESLDLETYFGETMLSRRKRVARTAFYIQNTRSFFSGAENPDTNMQNVDDEPLFQMFEEKAGTAQLTYDEPPRMLTEQDYIVNQARWSKGGRIFIRNVDPVPLTILSISPQEEDPVQGTYKRV